jgi:hypothetical protein
MSRHFGEPLDVWIYEVESRTATRLTFDSGRTPIWTPDGHSVTYVRTGDQGGIYVKPADGLGEKRRLIPIDAFHWLVGWTPDQQSLAYALLDKSLSSIMVHRDGQSRRVVGGGSTWGGRLSRDGKWLVYYWLEAGAFEVYVTPFPEGGTRWLIAEGMDPTWSPDGDEVYYRSGSRLMAARVDKTKGIKVLSHRLVMEPFHPPQYDDYDIHPDGRTMVIVRPADRTQWREVTMVLNWDDELKRLTSK